MEVLIVLAVLVVPAVVVASTDLDTFAVVAEGVSSLNTTMRSVCSALPVLVVELLVFILVESRTAYASESTGSNAVDGWLSALCTTLRCGCMIARPPLMA